MFKMLTLSVAVLALSAVSLSATTTTPKAGTTTNQGAACHSGTCCGANFVDANKDGVCDNAGTKKGSGQGMKRGEGKGKGCCAVKRAGQSNQ